MGNNFETYYWQNDKMRLRPAMPSDSEYQYNWVLNKEKNAKPLS